MPKNFFAPRLLAPAFAVCLFLLVTGVKWATFDRFGSAMPDWDQWDAEAGNVFIPWFENDKFVEHLFTPHNEHRVVLTKLQSLGLVLLNGQWDSRLEAATNALLHAALAAGLWLYCRRWIAPRWQAALFVLVAALFGAPLAWQNVLGGFHSQQYWLLGLTFGGIATLPFARPGSGSWWFGALCVVLALGSMGSGLFAAVVVTMVVGWLWLGARTRIRDNWATLLVCLAAITVGVLTRVEVDYHQHMKVKTVHDFVLSMLRSLEWPLRDRDWAGAILWLPWALVCWRALRGKSAGFRRTFEDSETRPAWAPADERDVLTITALGGWVLLQIAATAYARGAGADYPASRYMDTLAFGTAVNGLALAWLLSVKRTAAYQRYQHYALAVGWVAVTTFGLHAVLDSNLRYDLRDAKKYYVNAEANLRGYLATDDPKHLARPDLPYPSAEGLIERLSRPSLRALMALPIRKPLTLQPAEASVAFQENDARGAPVLAPPRAGLSPATAPLDGSKSWGSFSTGAGVTGTWKSHPITAGNFGWLKFETAGDLGQAGVSLVLLDAQTGATLTTIKPTKIPGDRWRAAYVRTPRTPFIVAASDTAAAPWLAFSPPVEMGAGSYWAWQAVKHGWHLVWLALAGIVLVGFAAWQSARNAYEAR
ncbi:MAG: hypothetical protein ABIQ12_04025 [Opitutaceae bacterium]